MADTSYQPKVYRKQGGEELVVADGGQILVESGGKIMLGAVELAMAGAAIADITATAAEINAVADVSENTEIVIAANVITAAESGKTFFLNAAAEFASTLPAPAAGLRFSFIVTAAPVGANYTVGTNAGANIIKLLCVNAEGVAGASDTDADVVNFVDGQAVAGDRLDVICDGTNWFAYGSTKVAAGMTSATT